MAKHLTEDQKKYVLQRYNEGTSLRAIGREIERPDITVRRTLESMGVEFGVARTTNKRSSPETEALVVRLYDEGTTWALIMEQAYITDVTVSKILKRNGRDLTRQGTTEGEEEIISALYAAGHSARHIGEKLGHSKTTIVRSIVTNGGKIRIAGCEYPDYFDVVDTPEKAYWLGFIAADGCMITTAGHPEGDHLAIQLAIVDRDHLAKLKKVLGAQAAILTGANTGFGNGTQRRASLTVGSRRLAMALIALGITPRKSATAEPWNGPADLMPHYWRGMVDGDGSIARKGDGLWTLFLCGSEACVRAFTAWAHDVCGTNATPYFKSGCWYVSIAGRYQVRKLVAALYENVPVSLDRKQERANAVLAAGN
jgi:hypothetical protein